MQEYQCDNCGLLYQDAQTLANHQRKFCAGSNYADLSQLEREFAQKSKGRDISLYGKLSLLQHPQPQLQSTIIQDVPDLTNSRFLQQQYESVLGRLSKKQDLKKKLERERNQAYRQLQLLEKRENQALIGTKQDELQTVLEKRKRLQDQERQIQEEMKEYQARQKQFDAQIQQVDREDYIYKEAQKAGKLARQRELLQEQKRALERNLKNKQKQKQEIEFKLNESKASEQDFVPLDFRKPKPNSRSRKIAALSHHTIKMPEDSLDSLSFQNTSESALDSNVVLQHNPNLRKSQPPYQHQGQNIGIQYSPTLSLNKKESQPFPSLPLSSHGGQPNLNLPHQKSSNPYNQRMEQTDDYPYLRPEKFSQNQKLLSDMVNREGKSEEDLFIQQLNAQEYDSLNLLAKLPKGSQLYELKLRQYQEISRLRDEYKKQAHERRVEKMKREFEFEKKLMEKQMTNALWVDQNRKIMLAQQMSVVRKQQELEKQRSQNFQSSNRYPSKRGSQQQNKQISQHQLNPYSQKNQIPSIQYMRNKGESVANINDAKNSLSSGKILSVPKEQITRNPNQEKNFRTQMPNDTDNLWGYRIRVNLLRNYNRHKPVKIKLLLIEQGSTGSNAEGQLLYTFSTSYHFQKIPPEEASFNPNISNKFDREMNVVYAEDFVVSENLQERFNSTNNDFYLFLVAQEKDETRLSEEPCDYGWYCFKLTHFGQLKEGSFIVSLYADNLTYPHPADMNKKRKKLNEEITFETAEVVLKKSLPSEQRLQVQKPYNLPQIVSVGQNHSRPSMTSSQTDAQGGSKRPHGFGQPGVSSHNATLNSVGRSTKTAQQTVFIPNQFQTQLYPSTSKQPKNFDFNVAQLRTLPSYVGLVKLQISFINSKNEEVLPRQEVMSQMGLDMYNPLVNYTRMVRGEKLIPPSTIVFIRVLALNSLDYEVYMLGFTVFYLFFDKEAEPCKNDNLEEYSMAVGYFQLPLFWGNCSPHFATVEDLVQQYPLIPCVSILVGCSTNENSQPLPIPLYGQKVYNTLLFNVDENQVRLFQEQAKREKLPIRKTISSYLKFKGLDSKYSPDQALNYLFKIMGFTKDNTDQLFPLEYMAQYSSFFGVYFSVDGLIVPEGKEKESPYLYFASCCLYPPARYYQNKGAGDLTLIYEVDSELSQRNWLVMEGNEIIFEPKFDVNSCAIIEIKRVKWKEGELSQQVESVGHAIIPLFKQLEGVCCVNVMKTQINIYSGPFNPKDLSLIRQGLSQYLDNLAQTAKPASVELAFRIMNGFFSTQFSKQLPTTSNRKTSYLRWFPRPIDFEDAKNNLRILLERKYGVSLS